MNAAHRIRDVRFYRVDSSLTRPIADATHSIDTIRFVVCRITLGSGVTGDGYLLSFDYSPHAIEGALRDLRPLIVDRPCFDTGGLARDHEHRAEYFGGVGLQRSAVAIADLAMWDAWAKTLGAPVHRLIGSHHDRVAVYGSGGWLSYTIDELIDEVTGYAKRGFQSVKIKVGTPAHRGGTTADVERLTKVREAVGGSIGIMMDANQGMTYPEAAELSRSAMPQGIRWFEEPLPHDDFDGYAQLRTTTGIALAMGEREFDTVPLRELAMRRGIDLWQPDVVRLGGVAGWRDSAAVAQAFGLPVLPHFYKEYDAPLLCTIKRPFGCESFDWIDGLIDYPIAIEDGWVRPSDRPGWGFRFKDDCLTQEIARP